MPRSGDARAEDPVVRGARRAALRRRARRERAARQRERAGDVTRSRRAEHVRPAARTRASPRSAATSSSSPGRRFCSQTDDEFPVLVLTDRGVALLKDATSAPDLALARQRRPVKGRSTPRARVESGIVAGRRSRPVRAPAGPAPRDRARRAACRPTSSSTTRRCARWPASSPRRQRRCATSTASASARPRTWGRRFCP